MIDLGSASSKWFAYTLDNAIQHEFAGDEMEIMLREYDLLRDPGQKELTVAWTNR